MSAGLITGYSQLQQEKAQRQQERIARRRRIAREAVRRAAMLGLLTWVIKK